MDVSAEAVAMLLALMSVVPGGTIAGELSLLVAAGAVSVVAGAVAVVVADASGVVVCAIAALPISAAAIRRGAFIMESPCMSGLGEPVPPLLRGPTESSLSQRRCDGTKAATDGCRHGARSLPVHR